MWVRSNVCVVTMSAPLTVSVLTAVCVAWCVCSESPWPGCDNGKLYLHRDLAENLYWDCPVSTWSETTKKQTGIDMVYDPEPARQICMEKPIFYKHTIPNSGVYRPVRAESGEYLYCPPQRWLNNLHHAATVLLYHPCAPLHERLLLSVLARSCLQHFIITPYPKLNKQMPIALLSWGRTLELSTMASPNVCNWLGTTTATRNKFDAARESRKYNLLLIWSAEEYQQQNAHPEEHSANNKGSVRTCCEQTISSLLIAMEEELDSKSKRLQQIRYVGISRERRSAMTEKEENVHNDNVRDSTKVQSSISMVEPSGDLTLSDLPFTSHDPPQELSLRHTSLLGSNMSVTTLTTSERTAELPRQSDEQIAKADILSPAFRSIVSVHDHVPEAQSVEKNTANPTMNDKNAVEHEQRHNDTDTPHTGDFVPTSQILSVLQPQQHPNRQPSAADSHNCDYKAANAGAALVNKGLSIMPRTDEAVWAAVALGFLLVLLALSVLHTRLYRHWRSTPSLYWYDPQQDYERVTDVIRRRLRIAQRSRKRGRRQGCVVLPSSSSSDEHP